MIFLICAIIWDLTASVKCKIWLQERWTKCVNQWHKLTTLEKMVADDRSFGFCLKINKSSFNSGNNDSYMYFHKKKLKFI